MICGSLAANSCDVITYGMFRSPSAAAVSCASSISL